LFFEKKQLTVNKQVSSDQVFTTLIIRMQFQKVETDAGLTGKAPPHNLGLLYSQQVSILFAESNRAESVRRPLYTRIGMLEKLAGGHFPNGGKGWY
jgi:hypothetical protein